MNTSGSQVNLVWLKIFFLLLRKRLTESATVTFNLDQSLTAGQNRYYSRYAPWKDMIKGRGPRPLDEQSKKVSHDVFPYLLREL
jgi:hypothetical protein